MTNSIDDIFNKSMSNAFVPKEDTVIEEVEPTRKEVLAKKIAEAREAKKLAQEKELEEAKTAIHKSENATTSDEKTKEIVEKNVKNKITINPDMKESIVGKIYQMYNNKYLDEKATPESGTGKYYKEGQPTKQQLANREKREKIKQLTNQGKHKEASALHNEEAEKKTLTIEETDKIYLLKANGEVAYEVTDLLLPDPIAELNRYGKETGKATGSMNKRPGSPVKKGGSTDKALNAVRGMIRKETGKPEGQRKKVKGAKSSDKTGKYLQKLKSKRAYAAKAKKAGFKSTQDYTNTMARYGGEDNYKKGRGLGT